MNQHFLSCYFVFLLFFALKESQRETDKSFLLGPYPRCPPYRGSAGAGAAANEVALRLRGRDFALAPATGAPFGARPRALAEKQTPFFAPLFAALARDFFGRFWGGGYAATCLPLVLFADSKGTSQPVKGCSGASWRGSMFLERIISPMFIHLTGLRIAGFPRSSRTAPCEPFPVGRRLARCARQRCCTVA